MSRRSSSIASPYSSLSPTALAASSSRKYFARTSPEKLTRPLASAYWLGLPAEASAMRWR